MKAIRWPFAVCFAAALIMIAVSVQRWGAAEIRADRGEVFFLTAIGTGWLLIATKLFSWLGLSYRDDVVERANVAALAALCGAILAVALIYTGGNLGEGPSYWNNVFSVALGTSGLFSCWILLELAARVSRSIAEERDLASGIRLAGFLFSLGLILSRVVAGDWHSAAATIADFLHDGWPAIILTAAAMGLERFARPSRHRPFPPWRSHGLLPALFYFGCAVAWCWHLGPWEGMPR